METLKFLLLLAVLSHPLGALKCLNGTFDEVDKIKFDKNDNNTKQECEDGVTFCFMKYVKGKDNVPTSIEYGCDGKDNNTLCTASKCTPTTSTTDTTDILEEVCCCNEDFCMMKPTVKRPELQLPQTGAGHEPQPGAGQEPQPGATGEGQPAVVGQQAEAQAEPAAGQSSETTKMAFAPGLTVAATVALMKLLHAILSDIW
ncbi:hypothetical protein OESDEN_12385 [Oesophagostomum dentatum]|uniref:Activin types I and II receptor domain protein n=1 Tax=Oesophagostomum dentatum TaxID=61180 RepID=A0A0B1SWC8_OESDE|nr:hypothetical protein OESDEN_12385 [Oesophagostomum dentatum]